MIRAYGHRTEEKAMTLATEISRGARRAIDAGSADIARLRGRMDKGMRRMRRSASRRIQSTNEYVHEHPWMVIAVVAGAAALGGLLAARLVRRDRLLHPPE
jgi:ElaB/YqjD/DUF883 family membrane-anchored ribosome-binding protein|nr:MAG: hypothetical protein DIU62_08570 [Pseudomonadota bacterium]